jgi:hypothetical protein
VRRDQFPFTTYIRCSDDATDARRETVRARWAVQSFSGQKIAQSTLGVAASDADVASLRLDNGENGETGKAELYLVEVRTIELGCTLITGGERFRHAGDAGGFDEKEIAHPGLRQRHDPVFVFKDKTKAPAFVEPAEFPYQGIERPMRSNIKYVIRHSAIIAAFRDDGKPMPCIEESSPVKARYILREPTAFANRDCAWITIGLTKPPQGRAVVRHR